MANRYWVGGAGTWNTTSTTNWSTTSGGASGASVPTGADSVFFDQAGTYTVTMTGALNCLDITVSAGTVTFATGTTPTLSIAGSMSLRAGTVWSMTGGLSFTATSTGKTITTNGTSLSGGMNFSNSAGGWTLGSALTIAGNLTVTAGSFSSGNYAISASQLSSTGTLTRSISLGSSTVSCSSSGSTTLNLGTTTNLTFNAGTSQINISQGTSGISSGGLTFYNVTFTSVSLLSVTITGANTFNNLTFQGRNTAGVGAYTFSANQTINGTLFLNLSAFIFARHFLLSDTVGTQRTLTCNVVDGDGTGLIYSTDFKDIAFAGNCVSAGNVSGFYLGDCKGNSNITFDTPKTVYYRQTGSTNWGNSTSWSATSGGVADPAMFPLAQDTAIFPAATYPASGSTTTINAAYNIGTIDMSLRTSNTMTLAMGSNAILVFGNWINGTGITISGTGSLSFQGRGSQTITSAGRSFTQNVGTISPGGTVTLQDAFVTTSATQSGISAGTFNANGYNYTATGFSSNNTGVRTIALGSGTWTLNGIGSPWNTPTITNLTVTGTGTISLTSASPKIFNGGGITTYPTLNQGGTGTLTITGANTFSNITNTAIGNITFPAGVTTTVSAFNVSGNSTTRVQLRSSSSGTRFTLSDASGIVSVDWLDIQDSSATGGATWYAGANSLNTGNNLGWIFTAPPSVGYGGNFLAFF